MKSEEREEARTLRAKGMSLREILKRVGASKSSVSRWVRDIKLTEKQLGHLRDKRAIAVEKYSATMRFKRDARIQAYFDEADREYEILRRNPRFMFGLALYIGEGTKSVEGTLQLGNCDPAVLRYILDFFEIIGFPREQVRCHIAVHPNRSVQQAERYWQTELGLGASQFNKTSLSVSRASAGKRIDKQPFGTCNVTVYSVKVKHKLDRWMEIALGRVVQR